MTDKRFLLISMFHETLNSYDLLQQNKLYL